jgi:hypothetical protein
MLAVSYEPIERILACRFKTGVYVFEGVPEVLYQHLIKSTFAGAYFRTQIRGKYPGFNPEGIPIPAKTDDSAVTAKQKMQAAKRLKEAPKAPEMAMTLFGPEMIGKRKKK